MGAAAGGPFWPEPGFWTDESPPQTHGFVLEPGQYVVESHTGRFSPTLVEFSLWLGLSPAKEVRGFCQVDVEWRGGSLGRPLPSDWDDAEVSTMVFPDVHGRACTGEVRARRILVEPALMPVLAWLLPRVRQHRDDGSPCEGLMAKVRSGELRPTSLFKRPEPATGIELSFEPVTAEGRARTLLYYLPASPSPQAPITVSCEPT